MYLRSDVHDVTSRHFGESIETNPDHTAHDTSYCGCTDLAWLVWVHGFQFITSFKLMTSRTLLIEREYCMYRHDKGSKIKTINEANPITNLQY